MPASADVLKGRRSRSGEINTTVRDRTSRKARTGETSANRRRRGKRLRVNNAERTAGPVGLRDEPPPRPTPCRDSPAGAAASLVRVAPPPCCAAPTILGGRIEARSRHCKRVRHLTPLNRLVWSVLRSSILRSRSAGGGTSNRVLCALSAQALLRSRCGTLAFTLLHQFPDPRPREPLLQRAVGFAEQKPQFL